MSKNKEIESRIGYTQGDKIGSGQLQAPAAFRTSVNPLLNLEAYRGQYIIVHSAPTAWIGLLVEVERREEAIGVTLADAGLWINGDIKEMVVPGFQQKREMESSHHHLTHVPIVTAAQPCGWPMHLDKWAPQFRGERPGDPNRISLEDYAKFQGTDVPTAIKALQNAGKSGRASFTTVLNLVKPYADEVRFPAPGVAAMLMTDILTRQW